MTTTTALYLGVTQNLPRYQTMTATDAAVKTAGDYYRANIGAATSIAAFVGNYRLLSYALQAYGLGDQVNSTALVRKVLEGGIGDPKSLANTLADARWKAFATAFDFVRKGAASIATPNAVAAAKAGYVEQQLEANQGAQNPGVELALYFQRVGPTATNQYSVLADKNLLQVAQTIFDLPPATSATDIDAQAATLGKLMPVSDLQDPVKLKQLTLRFTAMYDLKYGANSNATTALTVASATAAAPASAAVTILGDVISANGDALAGLNAATTTPFSAALLTSLQGFTLGG